MANEQFTVTESAANQIANIISNNQGSKLEDARILRISILGGGCSGFQYQFDLIRKKNADDIVIIKNNVEVVIDPISINYLSESQLDYVDELVGAAFKITNPNTTANCGCGNSFSV